MATTRPSRIGMTIVELLVAMGIVGILIALILPAVLNAHEGVRRSTCAFRHSQLGKALQNYESTYAMLPLAGLSRDGLTISPFARLLPFLDQASVSDSINFSRLIGDEAAFGDPGKANRTAARVAINTLLCPSDSATLIGTNAYYCLGPGPSVKVWHRGGYIIDYGAFASTFPILGSRRMSELQRGSSALVAFAERAQGDGEFAWFNRMRDIQDAQSYQSHFHANLGRPMREICQAMEPESEAGGKHFSESGKYWILPGLGWTGYTHAMTPNSTTADCAQVQAGFPNGAVTARSFHSKGVNVTFADGHVQFVSNDIDPIIWKTWSQVETSPK